LSDLQPSIPALPNYAAPPGVRAAPLPEKKLVIKLAKSEKILSQTIKVKHKKVRYW